MAKFLLTAETVLTGPTNLQAYIANLNRALGNVTTNVNLKFNPQQLNQLNQVMGQVQTASRASARALAQNEDAFYKLGKSAAVSIRRFSSFVIATAAIRKVLGTFNEGVKSAIEYKDQLVRISQVTGTAVKDLKDLDKTVSTLSKTLGVNSEKLIESAEIFAQAGYQAREVKTAVDALAKAELAPTFGPDIKRNAEGLIAILKQFRLGVGESERALGSINAVSKKFAIESDDIIEAVKRAGGAFAAAGGNLDEFNALMTSVRATTRESAESIATGLRTIFTRIQRVRTINFFEQLGLDLTDNGLFVGPYEAIRRLSDALRTIPTTDPRFAQIVEELGGFRQISKVIPLIREFTTAERARQISVAGGNSLTEDTIKRQQSLMIQLTKVKEEFFDFIRRGMDDNQIKLFIKTILDLSSALIKVADTLKTIAPLISLAFLGRIGAPLKKFKAGFTAELSGTASRFAAGGRVPGVGNSDSVPALLTPGEFVVRKSVASKLGASFLQRLNSGSIKEYNAGGPVGSIGNITPSNLLLGSLFANMVSAQQGLAEGVKQWASIFAEFAGKSALYLYVFQQLKQLSSKVADSSEQQDLGEISESTKQQLSVLGNIDKNVAAILNLLQGRSGGSSGITPPFAGPSGPSRPNKPNTPNGPTNTPKPQPRRPLIPEDVDLADHRPRTYTPDKPLSIQQKIDKALMGIPDSILEYLGDGLNFNQYTDKDLRRGYYVPKTNTVELNRYNPKEDYEGVLYHELGHAVDYRGGKISSSKQFIDAFNKDVSTQSPELKSKYDYYTGDKKEAFAELFAQQLGKSSLYDESQSPAEFQTLFPNLNKFMKETVQDLFGKLGADVGNQPGTSKALRDEIQHYMDQLPPALKEFLEKNNVKVMISRLKSDRLGEADYDRQVKLSQSLTKYPSSVRKGVLYHELGHQYDFQVEPQYDQYGSHRYNLVSNKSDSGFVTQDAAKVNRNSKLQARYSDLFGSRNFPEEIFAEAFAFALGQPSTIPGQSYNNEQFQKDFAISIANIRKAMQDDGILGADSGKPKVSQLTKEQLLRLAGAAPFKGAQVKFSRHEDGVTIDIYHHVLDGPAMREIYDTPRGIAIENELLNVKPEFRGKGIASTSLLSQVLAARALNIPKIDAVGLRDPESFGYYALPAMGYNAKVRGPQGMTDLNTLMSSEEGRAYWKQFGQTTPVSFDTRANSRSMEILNDRMKRDGVLGADNGDKELRDFINKGKLPGGPDDLETRLFLGEIKQNEKRRKKTQEIIDLARAQGGYSPPQGPMLPTLNGSYRGFPPNGFRTKNQDNFPIGDLFNKLFSNTTINALIAGAADTLGSNIKARSADSLASGNYGRAATQAVVGNAIEDATRFGAILSQINPVLGVFAGAAYGATAAFIQTQIDIEKVKFAESFGRFRKMLDDFSDGLISSDEVIVHFSSNLSKLENRIVEVGAANESLAAYFVDFATPLEAAKSELENTLTQLQAVLSKTAEGSATLDEFNKVVGEETIGTFARLTNQSVSKLQDSYKKQIDSQVAATKANKEFIKASSDYITRISNLQAFANSISNATSAVEEFGNVFSLESLAPTDNRNLFTQFNDKALRKVSQLQGLTIGDFGSEYQAAARISDVLPAILAKVKVDPLGTEEGGQDLLSVIRSELSDLTGLNITSPLLDNVINAVKKEIGETGQSTKFLEKLEQDFPETLDNIRKAITPLSDIFANVDALVGGLRTNIDKLIGTFNQLEIAIREKLLRVIDIREQAGVFNNKNDFVVKLQADFARRQLLTGGLNVGQLGQRRLDAQNNIIRLNREIENADAQQAIRLTALRKREEAVVEQTTTALEFLADASTRNAHLQDELTRLQELRKNRGDFAAEFAFSGGLKQAEIARTVVLAQKAAATGSIKGLSEEDKSAILSLFKQFGQDKLFAGLSGEDAIKKIVGNQFGAAGFGQFGKIIAGAGETPGEIALKGAINDNFKNAIVALEALKKADVDALGQLKTSVERGLQDVIAAIFQSQFTEKDLQLATQIAEKQRVVNNQAEQRDRLAGIGIRNQEQLEVLKTNLNAAAGVRKANADLTDAQTRTENAKKILQDLFYSGKPVSDDDVKKAITQIRTELSGILNENEIKKITDKLSPGFGNNDLGYILKELQRPGGSERILNDRNAWFNSFNSVITENTNPAINRFAQTVEDTATVVQNIPAQLQGQVFGGSDQQYQALIEQFNQMDLSTSLQTQQEELRRLEEQRKALLDMQTQTLNELEKRRQTLGLSSGDTTQQTLLDPNVVARLAEVERRRRASLGYNSGGLVPGTGNRDTQPAMLTPGEVVINRQGVANIGANTLLAINSGIFSDKFNETMRLFSRSANALVGALNNFPSSVSHTINGRVEVIINGAEVLSKLGKPLQELIEGKITAAISKFAQAKFPDL